MEKRRRYEFVQSLPPLFFLLVSVVSSLEVASISLSEVQNYDKVLFLPGLNFNVSFAHYSGYINVDKNSGRALFYWFFEAVEDPASKPIVLWLNGGPGCSSIAYGVAEEVGPFHVNPDGKSLYLNPYSWNQVANILFLDSPVGVGYSYSNNTNDLLSNGDERTANDSLKFLEKWFKRYPQYKGRDFYLTGESYAGHYVPQLAQVIVKSQKLTGDKSINLKGFMVGNALTDDFNDHFGIFQFMWAAGLISDQTYKLLHVFCDFESFIHTSEECNKVLDTASNELGDVDPYSIFTPSCPGSATFSRNKLLKRLHSVGRIGEKYDPCTEKHSTIYFNLPEVQKALHVNPAFAPSKWETCSNVVNENWKDSPRSILPIYRDLIDHGLRIWIFRRVYQQSNEARLYQLEQELSSSKQESKGIQEFYSSMMLIWNEMDMIDANIPEAALPTILKLRQQSRTRQFLMKLRPEFETIRGVILNRGGSYILDNVLSELLEEETHLQCLSSQESTTNAAFLANSSKDRDISKIESHNCHEMGHNARQCKKFCVVWKRII